MCVCVRACVRERDREKEKLERESRDRPLTTDESFNSSGLVSELLNGKKTKTLSVQDTVSQS